MEEVISRELEAGEVVIIPYGLEEYAIVQCLSPYLGVYVYNNYRPELEGCITSLNGYCLVEPHESVSKLLNQ